MASDDVDTDRHAKLRPMSRVRVVYDGDPVTARVEAVQSDGRGGEVVVDLPVASVALLLRSDGARLELELDGEHVEAVVGAAISSDDVARLRARHNAQLATRR